MRAARRRRRQAAAGRVFDGVFVINLARRPDRLANVQAQLARWGVGHEVQAAWDGEGQGEEATDAELRRVGFDHPWKRDKRLVMSRPRNRAMDLGRKGCTVSHVAALQEAVRRGMRSVLIFEDDIIVHAPPAALPPLPRGACIGYVGWSWALPVSVEGRQQWQAHTGGQWFRQDRALHRVWCTHAYIVQEPQTLLAMLLLQQPKAIDAMFKSHALGALTPLTALPCFLFKPTASVSSLVQYRGEQAGSVTQLHALGSDVTGVRE